MNELLKVIRKDKANDYYFDGDGFKYVITYEVYNYGGEENKIYTYFDFNTNVVRSGFKTLEDAFRALYEYHMGK